MKDEWKKYLQSIGFQDPLLKQADLALQFYSNFSGMDIDLIFVSEYRDSEKIACMSHYGCFQKITPVKPVSSGIKDAAISLGSPTTSISGWYTGLDSSLTTRQQTAQDLRSISRSNHLSSRAL